ncbi:hypothetical protein PVAP13_6NG060815 [Panicum virgatum]|uniref:Endonuclease/exonuclease/phosphatase domain-containing protein n=1 Tax=Panicum virgatum TaxID=38727 RepID=A0A8T0QTU4_PANVG|nr:hypothetical protein PVAP13_6NG060815 [Panicum virgatum]
MKGVFWNSNGLADLAKHRYLADLVREEQIEFIALMETGRDSFPDATLKHLCAGKDYLWHSMAPHGRSGGMPLGVDLSTFDIGAISEGDYYVKFTLHNKCDGFKWVLYAVYGPGQQEHKESFLIELANSCSRGRPEDKSTDNFDFKWPNIFNQVIEVLDLKEIEMSGRQFTWASYGDNPIFEKLDRVLVTTEWEENFPISSVQSRDGGISDHTPIVLNTGASTHMNNQPLFKLERGWFLRDGFFDMVANI